MPVYGKNLPRYDGFVAGNGVKDSSVYLDGNVLYVDVIGDADQGQAPAFVVRGLDAATNAPTELFRVNKDGSTTASVSVGVVGDLSSSYVAIGSVGNYLQGDLKASYVSVGSVANYITAANASLTNPYLTTPILLNGTITGGITTAADRGAQLFNILAFGASAGASFNNSSAINAACSAAYAATGGIVYIPGGRWLTGPIILGNRVTLAGAGMKASELVLIASQSRDFITNHQSGSAGDPYGKYITVRDLSLDCNGSSQASGNGIYWNAPSPGSQPAVDDTPDSHQLIENVIISNAKVRATDAAGAGENRYQNIHAYKSLGDGFGTTYDSWWDNCTAEKCGLSGFYIDSSSVRMQNCKAFYSGTVAYSSNGNGSGYRIFGISSGIVKLTNCEAQDNGAHGFQIDTCRHVSLVNCGADSNGWGHAGSLSNPGTWMAVDIWNSQFLNIVALTSTDRAVDHGLGARVTQSNAIRCRSKSAYVYAQGSHGGADATIDASMGPALGTIDATVHYSSFIFNGNTAASVSSTSGSASQLLTGG